MLCIRSKSTDPYFNLAAEEYFFKNYSEDIFFLYVNSPAVVVGKHQNALAEINNEFVRLNEVSVIRRLSGGGAVYHDLGNLNFSFHQSVEDTAKISFKKFNEPIVKVLHQLGVNAQISKRNDIFVEEFKVSGHAEHVFRNRILSHGTLLFNANRENLSKALKNESGTYIGKAIQSVRSKVSNIVDFLEHQITLDEFVQQIQKHILDSISSSKIYTITNADKLAIQELINEKYATWNWNFGYSPKYRFENEIVIKDRSIGVSMFVEKGLITEIEITSKQLTIDFKSLQSDLLNSPHQYEAIQQKLIFHQLSNHDKAHLLACFF